MNLTREAKEAVSNMQINELTDKNGVENLIAVLDQMYLKDKVPRHMKPMKYFENLWGHIICLYIKFEQLYLNLNRLKWKF